MSEATAPEKAKQAPAKRRSSVNLPFSVAVLPLLVLFVAAAILFWLSQKGSAGTERYWEIFIPIVAVVSLASGWSQAYLSGNWRLWYLVKQVVHWGALIALVWVLNEQGIRALMNDQQYTSVLIYLLAFGTLLAALHMDVKLLFFALFLTFCAYVLAMPQDNAALSLMSTTFGIESAASDPAKASVWVAVVGFIASVFVLVMMRGALMTKRISAKRKG